MTKAATSWRLLLFLVCFGVVTSQCSSDNIAGTNLNPNSNTVFTDTLYIDGISAESYDTYTGSLEFIAIGNYADALFGNIETLGIFRPNLQQETDFDTLLPTDRFIMNLSFDEVTYGDTTAESAYTIYQITNDWRDQSWRSSDQVMYDEANPIGSFTKTHQQDSLEVVLGQAFVERYADFYNDTSATARSQYIEDFPGFVIVPEAGNNAISYIQRVRSQFTIISATDTMTQSILHSAYSLNRESSAAQLDSRPLLTPFQSVLEFDTTGIYEMAKDKKLVNAELVFSVDTTLLQQSLSNGHFREEILLGQVISEFGLDSAFTLSFGTIDNISTFLLGSQDGAFRTSISTFVNEIVFGTPQREELVFALRSSNGKIFSTQIFDERAIDLTKRPQIVFTFLEL